MLPDTDTETRYLKSNNYNCSYALMDACKEIDRIMLKLAEADTELIRRRSEFEILTQRLIEVEQKGKIVYRRTLIGTGSMIEIPRKIAVCPYCDGTLTVHFEAWEQQDDGKWVASDVQTECDSEPSIKSAKWEGWMQQHSEMPYVYMLPVTEKIQAWINRHFYFEIDEVKK